MKKDPPIDEIRAVRHRISEQCGHDPALLLKHYQELEKKYQDRLLPNRPSVPATGR